MGRIGKTLAYIGGGVAAWYVFGGLILSMGKSRAKAFETPITIRAGETHPGSLHTPCVSYNGMPDENTFSISHCGKSAANIYLPTAVKKIEMRGKRLRVNEITPEQLSLTLLPSQ